MSPGPGHYEGNVNVVKDKIVSYDMGKSPSKKTFMEDKGRELSPGPGYYESDHKKIGVNS
jgi:hypothetical protein